MNGDSPQKRNWLKVGCLGLLGLFGVLVLISAIGAALMSPEEKARLDAERDAKQAQAKADDQKRVAAGLSQLRASFDKLAVPCDAAQMAVGDGLQNLSGGDRIVLAEAVQRMDGACTTAWLGIGDLEEPDGLTEAQEDAFAALERDCKTAFYSRKELAEQLMPVVDGDLRPSTIAGLKRDMAAMQGDVLRCSVALAGLDPAAPPPKASAE